MDELMDDLFVGHPPTPSEAKGSHESAADPNGGDVRRVTGTA